MVAKTVHKFDSFEDSERADRAFYAALTPQQRLDLLLEIIAREREGLGEAGERCARVCRVVKLPRR